ncbi:hypothetical protein [Paenibacillus turpanensis]|uniref:hypothetical protein n=1 Tax=Paenibacillus turpanensis TaxID=2689078 RepID=UPI00140A2C99|nr:hypothetical protein [Paenibacillus turpanensis]
MNKNNVYRDLKFSRTNLINIIMNIDFDLNDSNFDDFADWCHSYWSNWRSDNEGLFYNTDDLTINVVMEIYNCKLSAIKLTNDLIKTWLINLDEKEQTE